MAETKSVRRLTFEQLEAKLSPTTLLLVFAPLSDTEQLKLESVLADQRESTPERWIVSHDNRRLLEFIAEQTEESNLRSDAWHAPTEEQCRAADQWMRIDDFDRYFGDEE